ncbi:MAG: hypothetical protein WDA02_07450 [Saccharofermentanales bacterium]
MKKGKLKGVEEGIKFLFNIETYPGFTDDKLIFNYNDILLDNRLKKIQKIKNGSM